MTGLLIIFILVAYVHHDLFYVVDVSFLQHILSNTAKFILL